MMLFEPGLFAATRGVHRIMAQDEDVTEALVAALAAHLCADWGEVDEDDWQANNFAVVQGTRILSAYTIKDIKFYIITEADRSATTILLPEEY